MELQTIRPNLVQAIRAYRVEDLMSVAQVAGPLTRTGEFSGVIGFSPGSQRGRRCALAAPHL